MLPDWPAADQAAWEALFIDGDIFDGHGPLAHWRVTTRRKCAQSYGYWLAFLVQTGRLSGALPPAERVTHEAVKAYVDATLGRCSVETTHMRLAELLKIVRAMAPKNDWRWLEGVVERLRQQCRHGELKRRAGVSARDLYEWGCKRMRTAEVDRALSPKACAVQYREGLIVALLIARPLRLRTFLHLRLGRHLVERGGRYVLSFAPEDVKDNRAREYPLPFGLEEALARYLSYHRSTLLAGANSDRLWITKDGCAFSEAGFVACLAKLTRRAFGEALRPHAFRHIAATSVALDDPEHVNIIASILGHATLRTSERYYNRARTIEAASALQSVVRDLRKSVEPEVRRRAIRRPRLNRKVPT